MNHAVLYNHAVSYGGPPARPPVIREPRHAPVAHLVRGGVVEGVHYGSVVLLGADSAVELRLGDIEAAFYPRSALKPLQAVAMVRAGLPLDGELLALTAASHSGEAPHLAGTRRILELAGAREDDLRNIPDLPYDPVVRDTWVREGRLPSRLAQNCSGKHAAMLYTCELNGWSPEDCLDPAHPLQRVIAETVEDLTGQAIAQVSVDGCGAPLFAVSLYGLARAAARITTSPAGTPEARVADAMREHAEMASGSGRDVAALMRAVPGLLTKDGFEGVQVAALPDGRAVAVKISDGANRARTPVVAAALARAGVDRAALAEFAGEALLGGGKPVGSVRPVRALDPLSPTQARPGESSTSERGHPAMTSAAHRSDHDLLGHRDVPAEAYWGIHTLRAKENFAISGTPISAYPHLIDALAAVKEAAALANEELGLLEPAKAAAIVEACREIRDGKLHDQFVVDVIQGGAGTSTNMNANEVVANRALELLGHARGEYRHLHPNEDVNLGQSTNDVYPTAVKIATVFAVHGLLKAMAVLQDAFARKAVEFRDVLKMGRTQLQDAVPMTLGQEFSAYAVMIDEDRSRLAEAVELVQEINLGATAIGTGLNAPAGYAESARRHLADITGLPLVTAANLVEATQDCGAFVQMSGVLKRIAVKLSKSCNDLRLLSSGPRAGLNEINLPPVQAGSSIMPGKVNPVIPEVVNQVAFEVIGNDVTITMAAEAGQLQLNAFEPVILHSLSKSIMHLERACLTLAERCVAGITANEAQLRAAVENSIGLVTALNPHIGYEAATGIAEEALVSGRGVAELVLEKGLLPAERLQALLRPEVLAGSASPQP